MCVHCVECTRPITIRKKKTNFAQSESISNDKNNFKITDLNISPNTGAVFESSAFENDLRFKPNFIA